MKLVARAGGLALLVLSLVSPASSQTLTTLVSFNGTDGDTPWGCPTLVGNTLYGTTSSGGAYGYGTVYSIPLTGGSLTVLASFSQSNGQPYSGLTLSGNTLYGASVGGGAYGDGTVFSISLSGGSPTVLASFNGSNGANPYSALTLGDNTFYGETSAGGAYGDGTVYSIPPTGGSPTVLASFNGSNGAGPHSGLTLGGNTLYGTSGDGGTHGCGTVYSVPVSGGSPTILASFSSSTGEMPLSPLTLIGNALYGTTWTGGAYGDGTVFSVPLSGGTPTVLASFNGSNGANSDAALTLIGNTLYGVTYYGGAYGDGTVFSVPLSGGTPTVLASFNGSNGANPPDALTLGGNTLYGATTGGGAYGDGTVFALTLPSSSLSWTKTGGGSWANAGNWNGNQVPGSATPDFVSFGSGIGSSTATVTVDGTWMLGSLSFSTTGGGSYVITGSAGDTTSTLTLGGSLASFPLCNSGGCHTINVPIVLANNLTASAAAGSTLTIRGNISDNGGSSLTKTGAGVLILAGSNIYSGGTEVDAGVLEAANGTNGSATGSGSVTLCGGTLSSGTAGGSISGTVQAGSGASTVAPGGVGAVGSLTIGSLITSSSLTLNFDLTTPGGSGDLLIITSGLTLVPNTAITFNTDPTTPGDYRLIRYGSLSGDPSDLILPPAPSGMAYSLSTTADSGYIDLVAVPEPSTLVLLGFGVGLLGYGWWRRSRAA